MSKMLKRPRNAETRVMNITITNAEIERLDRCVEKIQAANPRLRPSRSLIIAEAIAHLVDGKAPIWERLD